MKWMSRIFVLALSLTSISLLAQTNWEEGTHYQVIGDNASKNKQVKEVFSFWCPHCFTFEAIATQLKSELPEDVSFYKAHVNFMGTTSQETQDAATAAMLAAKAMKQSDVFNKALFEAIHKDRKSIDGMKDIKAVFAAAGGDAERLEKMTKSFGIKGQVKKNNMHTLGFSRVPAFVVNDKYQANFTRDMTPDDFVALVIWLTKQQ